MYTQFYNVSETACYFHNIRMEISAQVYSKKDVPFYTQPAIVIILSLIGLVPRTYAFEFSEA